MEILPQETGKQAITQAFNQTQSTLKNSAVPTPQEQSPFSRKRYPSVTIGCLYNFTQNKTEDPWEWQNVM